MNMRKVLPVVFLVVLAVVAIMLRRCNNALPGLKPTSSQPGTIQKRFNRSVAELYFTKHARCRMKCRNITQQEVKKILAEGEINYNKSEPDDPKGATYALDGFTDDRQYVRIIFAPKQTHMTVVTVIDLGVEHQCNCN